MSPTSCQRPTSRTTRIKTKDIRYQETYIQGVRDLLPEQQGLRHLQAFCKTVGVVKVRDLLPEQQGLRQFVLLLSDVLHHRQRPTSRTTRIKTIAIILINDNRINVRDLLPEQQGLRPPPVEYLYQYFHVRDLLPEQQGLRLRGCHSC